MKLTYTDLHLHSEFSLQDGMIRVVDKDDPKHIKGELILNAERRGTGAATITDHGNMYGHRRGISRRSMDAGQKPPAGHRRRKDKF